MSDGIDYLSIVRDAEPAKVQKYAAKTELPAMKKTLEYIAKDKSKEYWVNNYCDYSDCGLLF